MRFLYWRTKARHAKNARLRNSYACEAYRATSNKSQQREMAREFFGVTI